MAFDVSDIDITQLFKNDDTYSVPRYQRNYVWNENNWDQLLKDIKYCGEITPDWSHFIGSMVFERKQKSGGQVFIIDGQQRILTFQIMIFALLYRYRKQLENAELDEISQKQCIGDIEYLRDLIINKVLGQPISLKVDNKYPAFAKLNQVMIDEENDGLHVWDNLLVSKKREDDIILKAFIFFAKYFERLSIEEVKAFNMQFLKTRVVTISSLQEEEVYNIFEILNARGVKLKQAELLKNYMFKYLKPKPLLDTYKEKWNKLEETLDSIDMDDYYYHIFRCWNYKSKMQKDQLFETTKECLHRENEIKLSEFFELFTSCGNLYKSICNADGDLIEQDAYEYFKLKTNKQIRPILLMLKLKYINGIINETLYKKLLNYIRNFFVIFNLDNNTSNKIDNDVDILAHALFVSQVSSDVELSLLKFLLKFSVYFKETSVLENGLKNIAYSNRSTRKNVSSRVLVYLFKPIVVKIDENKFAKYDFTKFNIEHVLNDSDDENSFYSLGNLLPCPDSLNSTMKNKIYEEKREILTASGITYLKKFAEKHDKFEQEDIFVRANELNNEFMEIYSLSHSEIKERFEKLDIQKNLGEQLNQLFGTKNIYYQKLQEMGVDKFSDFLRKNGSLPKEDVEIIKPLMERTA